MRCWIEGSNCLMHSRGDYEFGLLNVVISFCRGCSIVKYNKDIIENIFREVGIEPFEKPWIDENSLLCLADNAEVNFIALRFLERKYREKISKIKGKKDEKDEKEIIEKIEWNLKAISELREIFKKLKEWYTE